ncbi:hypothetical protein HZS38_02820 [Xenorhabdus nematophila]|uniref:Uncharacterized protein n=1 Tax=Xenorhabdus nematophila (strain ATCC 19061 / DSM 3370 / CCUG 14189 / LMG 1036 / NCIMB 9965 / AN6) TaxID=406817 RepID=D3VAE5_XENNA|nr:hypothetical protein [Xenorhabdus nematophila]CEE94505.1 hypothetical protein XNA1_4690014 [Xenorhabdus nematophila str. Anatoliense]CEF31819.1 hypothetical protein XNW1_410025 [Xenorhabdus nematophila str. Websteri]MBA0018169.1 hypothetical protein [Xenorhabdus nematophila]MCB4424770.1 hypothetical protein [Xenorhabdus nematophila]QNJ37253.1 hypothetical protein H8F46_03135 [Xenorhabdus nematophila]
MSKLFNKYYLEQGGLVNVRGDFSRSYATLLIFLCNSVFGKIAYSLQPLRQREDGKNSENSLS